MDLFGALTKQLPAVLSAINGDTEPSPLMYRVSKTLVGAETNETVNAALQWACELAETKYGAQIEQFKPILAPMLGFSTDTPIASIALECAKRVVDNAESRPADLVCSCPQCKTVFLRRIPA